MISDSHLFNSWSLINFHWYQECSFEVRESCFRKFIWDNLEIMGRFQKFFKRALVHVVFLKIQLQINRSGGKGQFFRMLN